MLILASVLQQQFREIRAVAPLVARGRIDPCDVLPALKAGAAKAAPNANPSGRDCRIAWALQDAVAACLASIERGQREIGWTLRPLLDAGATSDDLVAAAHDANARAGGAMMTAEVEAEIDRHIAAALRFRRRDGLRARRDAAREKRRHVG